VQFAAAAIATSSAGPKPIRTSSGSSPAASAAIGAIDAGHAGRGENQKAFARSKAEFADMLRERPYLAIKLAVANFPCRLAGYRLSERDPIRAQLRSACGQRVEAEGGNRMPAGKRVRFVQGCIFHHVSSVTLNSGAA
jgi:hypothetical protein